MKKILLGALCVVLVGGLLTTTSCKKGDQGPKGDSAIANVYYSPWMSLDTGWYYSDATQTSWYRIVRDSKIDSSMISTGDLHVYWNVNTVASPVVYNVPYVIDTFYIRPYFARGGFLLESNVNDAISDPSTGTGYYRYVLVKGSVKTGARTTGGSPVDWSDYSAVKAYLNIKD